MEYPEEGTAKNQSEALEMFSRARSLISRILKNPRLSFAKIMKRARSIPAFTAFYLSNIPFIEAKLVRFYDDQRIQHKPSLPALSPEEAAIVRALQLDGFCETSLEALAIPSTNQMCRMAEDLAKSYSARAASGEFKGMNSIQVSGQELSEHPCIYSWGLSDRLLRIVENYIETPVGYDGLNAFYTIADGLERGLRTWHLDHEDRRMVKLVVYIHDVNLTGGPFELLRRPLSAGQSVYSPGLTDQQLRMRLNPPMKKEDICTFTGPKGTVVFCDTVRLYHRGRPALSNDRFALFFNYMSRTPRNPFFCERSTLSRRQISELAKGLNEHQQACALWRKKLPLIARLLPPSVY